MKQVGEFFGMPVYECDDMRPDKIIVLGEEGQQVEVTHVGRWWGLRLAWWHVKRFFAKSVNPKSIPIPMTREIIKDGSAPMMRVCTEGHYVSRFIPEGIPRLPCGCPYPPDDPSALAHEGINKK
jgi:hypothetical protein